MVHVHCTDNESLLPTWFIRPEFTDTDPHIQNLYPNFQQLVGYHVITTYRRHHVNGRLRKRSYGTSPSARILQNSYPRNRSFTWSLLLSTITILLIVCYFFSKLFHLCVIRNQNFGPTLKCQDSDWSLDADMGDELMVVCPLLALTKLCHATESMDHWSAFSFRQHHFFPIIFS